MINPCTDNQCNDGSTSIDSIVLEGTEDEERTCPGEVASYRLARFEESWSSIDSSSISVNEIDKVMEEDLSFTRLMGRGSFADVFQVTAMKETEVPGSIKTVSTPQTFAIKKPSERVIADKTALQTCAADLAFETALLANMKHENIIGLQGIKEGDIVELMNEGNFFMALELLTDTLDCRLKRWRRERKRGIFQMHDSHDEIATRLQDVAMGIVNGMEYLHSKKILYRDLKPANIGFDDLHDQVKIFDFGLSRLHPEEDDSRLMTRLVGTPRYMAPELINSTTARYSYPIDVYSFSLLLWQIVSDRTPFAECKTVTSLYEKIQKDKRPPLKYIPHNTLKQLLEEGWSVNPADRPSFTDIRQSLDEFIADYNNSLAVAGATNKKGNILQSSLLVNDDFLHNAEFHLPVLKTTSEHNEDEEHSPLNRLHHPRRRKRLSRASQLKLLNVLRPKRASLPDIDEKKSHNGNLSRLSRHSTGHLAMDL